MNYIRRKHNIVLILTALSVLVLGICAIASATRKEDGSRFNGSYNLTAYADSAIKQITVSDKTVDVLDTARIKSIDGEYTLCLTVIDLADLQGISYVQVGYEIGEGSYFNGAESGLSNVVYSSLTFADDSSLHISELGLDEEKFSLPYFIVAEVPTTYVTDKIFDCIVAEKHTLEKIEGYAATCTTDGREDYYTCTDEDCNRYFTDSWGLREIADLESWKIGDGKIDALGHTEVIDEAVAPTCTETGITEGKHCSVCNEVLVAQTEAPALGHNYVNHICTTCGDLEKVAVNGVYYQFTVNSDNSGYHFVANGKADGFNSLYTGDSAQTLVLEDEIDGYPVTEIGESAFANTDDNPIKSVVVPENIVTIGEKAFLDNYGMQSAVFLADTVTILGNFNGGESGNNTPFYGCSTESGGNATNMSIYYNTVKYNGYGGNDLTWTRFRRYEKSAGIYKRYYIGCDPKDNSPDLYSENGDGTLYSNGSWSMVNTTISGADIVTECNFADVVNANVTTGIVNKYYTQTQGDTIKTKLEEALSVYKNELGANKYVVNVTVTNTVNSIATVAIKVSLNVPVEVQVNSAVAFSYTLENQSVGAGLTTIRVVKSGDNVLLYNPVASNYTFLGWAKEVDGALTFIESTTEYNADTVYYPIWGASKVGTAFSASIHTNGSTLVNPTGSGIDGKWYDGSWNEVTEISTANTIVYTRSIFTLKVYLKKATAQRNSLYVGNQNSKTNLGSSTSITIELFEGPLETTIDANNQVITIENAGVTKEIYAVEMTMNWKGQWSESGKKRTLKYEFDACLVDGAIVGSGQLTLEVQ